MSSIPTIEAYQAADGSLHTNIDSLIEADANIALQHWCKLHGVGPEEASPLIALMKKFGHEIEPAVRALERSRAPGVTRAMKMEVATDLRQVCLKLSVADQPEKTYNNPSGLRLAQ